MVGAGVAGPVIARRLSDNPWWRVLLIEAGPEEPSMTSIPGLAVHAVNSSLDWKFKTEPTEPHPTACLGEVITLGITINILELIEIDDKSIRWSK